MDHPPTERTHGRVRWVLVGLAGAGVLVALALLLDLGSAGEEELSEAEFLARGDEICRQSDRDFEELQGSAPATAGEAAELTETLIDISETELEQIRELGAPPVVEQPLERYLDAREQGIEELEAGLEAAQERDAFAYAEAQAKVAGGQVKRLQLAREVGFDECSRVLGGRDELSDASEPPPGEDGAVP